MEARTFSALKGVGKILTNWEESGGAKVETDPDMRKLVEVFKSLEKRYNRMNTAPVLKALEKRVVDRYSSADEMHGAAFECLFAQSKAAYSVYLSYRAESDWPIAKLLFDELNHSRTHDGHRVTVYLDTCGGHVQGADWDEDIAKGLLRSTIYCPILS